MPILFSSSGLTEWLMLWRAGSRRRKLVSLKLNNYLQVISFLFAHSRLNSGRYSKLTDQEEIILQSQTDLDWGTLLLCSFWFLSKAELINSKDWNAGDSVLALTSPLCTALILWSVLYWKLTWLLNFLFSNKNHLFLFSLFFLLHILQILQRSIWSFHTERIASTYSVNFIFFLEYYTSYGGIHTGRVA